jgi:hypothetical protein
MGHENRELLVSDIGRDEWLSAEPYQRFKLYCRSLPASLLSDLRE